MSFTDDDLAFIKECYRKTPEAPAILRELKIKELIERMEAAEDLASYAEYPPVSIYERWTKAAGK